MIVLAIDTCLGACSAAVLDGELLRAGRTEPMWRGHQERLASLVRETMEEAEIPFSALQRVGATVGPGSFTGLRVGIAFVKGLSVALDIDAVGVGTLECFAVGRREPLIVAADARRGQVYWQPFLNQTPLGPAQVSAIEDVVFEPTLLLGPGAPLLAGRFPEAHVAAADAPTPLQVADLVAAASVEPIRPLYLRPPDAKLPGGIDPFAS